MLLKQGICSKKIHLIRTAGPPPLPSKKRLPMEDGILRLAYWGRCDPVKGLHLVIDAILSISATSPIQLDFFGPYWESDYGQKLLNRINGDSRFCIQGNLPKEKVLERLQTYDLAVVPSTWYETGPLTVLEAFSAGLPVAGSNIGGIYELLVLNRKIQNAIAEGKSTREVENLAINENSMLTLNQYGVELVKEHLTTISEVVRVCNQSD